MNNYVRELQKNLGIQDDGLFGPKTLEAALAAISNGSNTDAPSNLPTALFPALTRPVNELIWHTSATPEGREVSVDSIRQWHLARGWADIGYHFVCHLDGTIEAGRDLNKVPASVAGHNRNTIAAVYIGGMDKQMRKPLDTRTPAQKKSMLELTVELCRIYNLDLINGHNFYDSGKACPSFDVRNDPLGNIPGFTNGRKN